MTKYDYIMTPSDELSEKGNLLIFSMYIKEIYKPSINLNITIPNVIVSKLSQQEFNFFFTDLLLDAKISDNNLRIHVTDSPNFLVKAD